MDVADVTRSGRSAIPFVATIFVSSFLLFLVQPMIARMVLPRLGGAPSVWNSAMLVYQALLLAGYAYAHWLARLDPRRQLVIHVSLLLAVGMTLPIGLISAFPPPDANPFLWVPWLLLLSVGPLFFAVSAQAPLIQRWFAITGAGDPYPLYAASNLGSFGGLIAYPLLVEPLLSVEQQRWVWSSGYVVLVMLIVSCATVVPRSAPKLLKPAAATEPPPTKSQLAHWILLAAVPSGLILSTTLHITTDILAMPLLWVLPLGAYLTSFTIAFAKRRRAAELITSAAPFVLLLTCLAIFTTRLPAVFCGVSIVNLFTVSVALHSRLYGLRPDPRYLTLFYLMMSLGGALGGLFCALVAPTIFNWTYEHLILLVAAAWLFRTISPFDRWARLWDGSRLARLVTTGGALFVLVVSMAGTGAFGLPLSGNVAQIAGLAIISMGVFAVGNRPLYACSAAALLLSAGGWQKLEQSATPGALTRSFFGIYSVEPGYNNSRVLTHGTTTHGIQNLGSAQRERMATTYYVPHSGVGLAMQAVPKLFGPTARVGIVGLGAGTLACYARPGEHWTFFEIDPAIVRIARDPDRFTFLSHCAPWSSIKVGDARLLIKREQRGTIDLLVLDAFSSDAIPMHLLTREAFLDYRRLLSANGLLMVHISNRYVDLMPVVAAAASEGHWNGRFRRYRPDEAHFGLNEFGSDWIALSPSPLTIEQLTNGTGGWTGLVARPGFAPWSDDYASVLPLIRIVLKWLSNVRNGVRKQTYIKWQKRAALV